MPSSENPLVWTPSAARERLRLALDLCALEEPAPRLLRFGTNAVYHLPQSALVIRITRPGVRPADIIREMALARWLAARDFPVTVPDDHTLFEPLGVMGSVVTAWHWVEHHPDRQPDPEKFGQLLSRFHELTADYPGAMPEFNPLSYAQEGLDALRADPGLPAADRKLLERWRKDLDDAIDALDEGPVGDGLLHGDAHLGNVLACDSGLVLLDFERLCWGPREWDLVPMAMAVRRFGGSPQAYQRFCRGYGFDVTVWEGCEVLCRARELMATVWRLGVDAGASIRSESERRLAYWRGSPNPPQWQAF
jgi:Ser/Thr protein kinase RdoA (MazF antagonist)